jgi:hypothetical protein
MSQSLIKALPHLLVLANSSPKLIRLIIQEGNSDLINALFEILNNIWEVKIILTPTARKAVSRGNKLSKIIKSKKRKAELKKHGPKILPLILPSVLAQIYGCQKSGSSESYLPKKQS